MNFDERAREWDLDEKKVRRARDVADGILKNLPDTKGMSAAEYGCGTGLLGFGLLSSFKEMTFCDTSRGMLEVVKGKIEAGGYDNCRTELIDPDKPEDTSKGYDCIFNLMLLHHLPDTEEALKGWTESLNEGGYLCIADLITEDGTFHSGDFDGHRGFDTEKLGKLFEENDLRVESVTNPHTIVRGDREYPLFLMIGRKG